jgi:hypothetical protein
MEHEIMKACESHHQRNVYLLEDPINCYFEDLLDMTDDEFEQWIIDLRTKIVDIWAEHNCPPRGGKNDPDIINNFNKLSEYNVSKFTHTDELSDIEDDVIINGRHLGVEVDQWFPHMYKTRINYNESDNGYSIYDLFADDRHLPRMIKSGKRHFKRDSFYYMSACARKNDTKTAIVKVNTPHEWLKAFETHKSIFTGYDWWLCEQKNTGETSTGYVQVDQKTTLSFTADEVRELWKSGRLTKRNISNIDLDNLSDDNIYLIRAFKLKHKKLFPHSFVAFRVGYIQVAHNYPPMTAKYLYERFTEKLKDQEVINIYDPSAGWGGRILGAMSVKDDRVINYIGTDPNPDNHFNDTNTSRYSDVADFFNTETYRGNPFFSTTNTYEIFSDGSEDISHNPEFQKYKEKLDLIFTSPPYFNREAYSEDEAQSYKRYGSSYEAWRDGFLRGTLKTCAEYLKPDRYLLWNIADLKVGKNYLPLEEDSKKILEEYGMVYKYTLKMAMVGMPGQNRVGEDGVPKCKNYCKVDGKFHKFEPVYVFYKPSE